MEEMFVQVIVPLKLPWIPVYRTDVPLERGCRVRVMLARKEYVGVVWRSVQRPDVDPSRVTAVLDLLEGMPAISPRELALWEFISSYYLCSLGEVYKAACPSMKLKSEALAANIAAVREERKRNTLEKMRASLKARMERLHLRLGRKDGEISKPHREDIAIRLREEREKIFAEIHATEIALVKLDAEENAFDEESHEVVDPLPVMDCTDGKPLLLGGPSRVSRYVELARKVLDEGRDVLLLTADILFSNALEASLKPVFPQLMLVNSKKSQVARRKLSDILRASSGHIVLGTRSSIFLPFRNLGLVIVDEEQDSSLKQDEPAPRYNARDCAMQLARLHGAKAVLGSACPSLESLYNCRTHKYEFEGIGGSIAPVLIIDIAAEKRKRGMLGTFSRKLVDEVSSVPGRVTFIRGWEKVSELEEEIASIFPSRDIRVMTLKEAKTGDLHEDALVAILQADALVRKDDFRADERARQIVLSLAGQCRRMVVQTMVASRFDGSRNMDDLMEERMNFGFPPFTRLISVCKVGSGEVCDLHFLPRDKSLPEKKAEIVAGLRPDTYLDVDPV